MTQSKPIISSHLSLEALLHVCLSVIGLLFISLAVVVTTSHAVSLVSGGELSTGLVLAAFTLVMIGWATLMVSLIMAGGYDD